jgi:hypothetical protein
LRCKDVNGNLYVTYAKQNATKHDDFDFPGFGFVDKFSPKGKLLQRLEKGPWLNAPLGVVLAPANFRLLQQPPADRQYRERANRCLRVARQDLAKPKIDIESSEERCLIASGSVGVIERHSDELAAELIGKLETCSRTTDLHKGIAAVPPMSR